MGLSGVYGSKVDDSQLLPIFDKLTEQGVNMWDSARFYGAQHNEKLIGKWFAANESKREDVFLSHKCGIKDKDGMPVGVDSSDSALREEIEMSLKNLNTSYIDLYLPARVDPNVDVEESSKTIGDLIKQGKVRYYGLSEVSEKTLRRAHAITPVSVVQIEYSPWTLDIEKNGLLKACEELGVWIQAYSPLSRGFLSGTVTYDDIHNNPNDSRQNYPRYSKENFDNNFKLVKQLQAIAEKKNVTASQLVLAWIPTQSEVLIPIPGTTNLKRLDENFGSTKVTFSDAELKEIREAIDSAEPQGDRYGGHAMQMCAK